MKSTVASAAWGLQPTAGYENADRRSTSKILVKSSKNAPSVPLFAVLSIPILGYIFSPFEAIPHYALKVHFVFIPIMVLSGMWMWKGHVLRRLSRAHQPNTMPRRNPTAARGCHGYCDFDVATGL